MSLQTIHKADPPHKAVLVRYAQIGKSSEARSNRNNYSKNEINSLAYVMQLAPFFRK